MYAETQGYAQSQYSEGAQTRDPTVALQLSLVTVQLLALLAPKCEDAVEINPGWARRG